MARHRVPSTPNASGSIRNVSVGKQPRNFHENRPISRRLPMPVTPGASSQVSQLSPTSMPESPASTSSSNRSNTPLREENLIAENPEGLVNNSDEGTVTLSSFVKESRQAFDRIFKLLDGHSQPGRRKRLPRALTSNVRTTVRNIYGNDLTDAWNLRERYYNFNSPQNEEVNVTVTAAVQNVQKISSDLIRDALRVYYRTRKRQFKMNANKKAVYLKEQRSRTRLNLKRTQREKALAEEAITQQLKEKYKMIMSNDYMSSEESSEELDNEDHHSDDENTAPFITLRKLPWRSQEVNDLFTRLDKRTARKRSRKGKSMILSRVQSPIASERPAPDEAPEWALRPGF